MVQHGKQLVGTVFDPLPLGRVRPAGWLLQQLRIQAEGLTGHLDEFWPDVAESGWIGGTAEAWERGPYWLDGLVPLAFLLDDPRLKAKAEAWIRYILEHQREDGWIGPLHKTEAGSEEDPWPVSVVLKAMTQYQEATGDARIIPAMLRFFHYLQDLLARQPLYAWSWVRSAELVLSLYWLYERCHEEWLLGLARTVQQQGYDWQTQFEQFSYGERQTSWKHESHGVNLAMALKQPALWYRLTREQRRREAVYSMIETLDTYHGQATGVFTADENLAGTNPSQGTELCAVVEYLFSLEVLLTILGEPSLADRWERIAFNALPATFKPDMWAHQYDQQANQVRCTIGEEHIYTTNGDEANIFGLEPNFGCCTANMHQGWPKFASHAWMSIPDGGLVALSYVPCTVATQIGGDAVRIEVDTAYPFNERIRMTVAAEGSPRFPLLLRIPSWAEGASLELGGRRELVQPDSFFRIEQAWGQETMLELHLPMRLRAQTRYHESVTLERGPLVYALKIEEEWRQVRGELPHADWEVYPKTPWNYAVKVEREQPERSCQVVVRASEGALFSPEGAPVCLKVEGRQVPDWTLERNAAGPLPVSPVSSTQPLEELTLIPYGCTNLRVTEFPVLKE